MQRVVLPERYIELERSIGCERDRLNHDSALRELDSICNSREGGEVNPTADQLLGFGAGKTVIPAGRGVGPGRVGVVEGLAAREQRYLTQQDNQCGAKYVHGHSPWLAIRTISVGIYKVCGARRRILRESCADLFTFRGGAKPSGSDLRRMTVGRPSGRP